MGLGDLDCILLVSGLVLILIVALGVIYSLMQNHRDHVWDGKVQAVDIHPHEQHIDNASGGLRPIAFEDEAKQEPRVKTSGVLTVNQEAWDWLARIKKVTNRITHWADKPDTMLRQDPLS